MESKYAVIDDIRAQKTYEDSQIEILRFQILQHKENGSKFLRYTMKNVGEKVVKSVQISVICYDSDKNKTDEIKAYEYKDIFAQPGECFGRQYVIPIQNSDSEQFDLYIDHVFFENHMVWNSRRILSLEHPQATIEGQKNADEMKLACKKANITNATYVPDIIDRFWRCTCGQMNESNANRCEKCKTEQTLLNETFHKEYLDKLKGEVKKEKEQQRKKEARERRQALKQKVQKRTKKAQTVHSQYKNQIIPIALCAVVLLVGGFLANNYILPMYHYSKGQKQLKNEQYILAQRQFEKSKNYKDAQKYEQYAVALADLEQVQDETNVGDIYNEVVQLGNFNDASSLLDKNTYLRKIKQWQGQWYLYEDGKRRTYEFSNGNVSINGQKVYQLVAVGNSVGLQSGQRGEIGTTTSLNNNEIVLETDTQVKVFHKKEENESSVYFPIDSYQTVLETVLQKKHKVVEKIKKNSSVYACYNLIDYLYGEGYAQFVTVKKAAVTNYEKEQSITLDDKTSVTYKKIIYIDVASKQDEDNETSQAETKHYVGYFDAAGENLVAYNEVETEISDEDADRSVVTKYNAYDIPNVTIPICQQVIETEMEKDNSVEDDYFNVSAVDVQKTEQDGYSIKIWGTDSNGIQKRIDGEVGYSYDIQSTTSQNESFDRNAYVGTATYDYAEQLAQYLQ